MRRLSGRSTGARTVGGSAGPSAPPLPPCTGLTGLRRPDTRGFAGAVARRTGRHGRHPPRRSSGRSAGSTATGRRRCRHTLVHGDFGWAISSSTVRAWPPCYWGTGARRRPAGGPGGSVSGPGGSARPRHWMPRAGRWSGLPEAPAERCGAHVDPGEVPAGGLRWPPCAGASSAATRPNGISRPARPAGGTGHHRVGGCDGMGSADPGSEDFGGAETVAERRNCAEITTTTSGARNGRPNCGRTIAAVAARTSSTA